MASLATLKNGTSQVWLVHQGARHVIRLGKLPEKDAETTKAQIERLAVAKFSGQPLRQQTADWLSEISDELHERIARTGLIAPRVAEVEKPPVPNLAPFFDAYVASRSWKPRTKINFAQVKRLLVEFLGADRPIDRITPADADNWRQWLVGVKKLAARSTAPSCLKKAKAAFAHAVADGVLESNPFAGMKRLTVKGNADRFRFVTPDEARAVLAACPNAQWRLLFALARFGGLRCPSEPRELLWADVNWEKGRMLVRSPKTEHHEGHDRRLVPIFPELLPHLKAAHDEALAAADQGKPLGHVITLDLIRRDKYANPRTQLERIVIKAGLTPWPKLFHNLRATRQTELVATFPEHVVCSWLGNSQNVAREHYLRVRDADFDRAATITTAGVAESADEALQKALMTTPALGRLETTTSINSAENSQTCPVQSSPVVSSHSVLYPLGESNPCCRTENPES